jgi:hypothetical protein
MTGLRIAQAVISSLIGWDERFGSTFASSSISAFLILSLPRSITSAGGLHAIYAIYAMNAQVQALASCAAYATYGGERGSLHG